jgi:hypothetical protein
MGVLELNLNAFSSDRVDNGNLVALISSYTGTDGSSHEMADVWFAKDVAGTDAKAAPKLDELLAAPQPELLGGTQPAGVPAGVPAAGAPVMHAGNLRGLLDEERQVPLI